MSDEEGACPACQGIDFKRGLNGHFICVHCDTAVANGAAAEAEEEEVEGEAAAAAAALGWLPRNEALLGHLPPLPPPSLSQQHLRTNQTCMFQQPQEIAVFGLPAAQPQLVVMDPLRQYEVITLQIRGEDVRGGAALDIHVALGPVLLCGRPAFRLECCRCVGVRFLPGWCANHRYLVSVRPMQMEMHLRAISTSTTAGGAVTACRLFAPSPAPAPLPLPPPYACCHTAGGA